MAIEILDFPMKNGDVPSFFVGLPEGSSVMLCGWTPGSMDHHFIWTSRTTGTTNRCDSTVVSCAVAAVLFHWKQLLNDLNVYTILYRGNLLANRVVAESADTKQQKYRTSLCISLRRSDSNFMTKSAVSKPSYHSFHRKAHRV